MLVKLNENHSNIIINLWFQEAVAMVAAAAVDGKVVEEAATEVVKNKSSRLWKSKVSCINSMKSFETQPFPRIRTWLGINWSDFRVIQSIVEFDIVHAQFRWSIEYIRSDCISRYSIANVKDEITFD